MLVGPVVQTRPFVSMVAWVTSELMDDATMSFQLMCDPGRSGAASFHGSMRQT